MVLKSDKNLIMWFCSSYMSRDLDAFLQKYYQALEAWILNVFHSVIDCLYENDKK